MPTIDAVIARAAAAAPDRIAVREWTTGRQMSYAALDAAVSGFAAWARAAGLQDGEAVAIHLPNCAGYLIAQFGSFRAGAVATYVNYRLSTAEALRQIRLCQARIVVTTADRAAQLRGHPETAGAVFVVAGGAGPQEHDLQDVIATLPAAPHDAQRDTPHDVPQREDCDAIIRFTSGSTGAPKGLIVTHRAWLVRAVSMLAEEMRIAPHSTTLLLGQLSHQAGLFVIPTFLQHGTVLLLEKFDLARVAEIFAGERIGCAQIVPTMFGLILNDAPAREALRRGAPGRVVYGGSPIRQGLLDQALELLPDTEFVQVYGSHEAGSISFLDGAGHRDARLRASAGKPLLPVQVRLRCAPGERAGEVEVKAPWQPHARITEQGREPIASEWSATGDVGELADGHIFLRDRMHDVIISGGFNVYPLEVEQVIDAHPGVLDSAVASAPDDKWGERVVAFVVARREGGLDPETLRAHCKALLAGYKVPKEFRLVPEVPVNANGKPDRRRLSEPLWAGRERRIN